MVFKIYWFITQHLIKDSEYIIGWRSKWLFDSKLLPLYGVFLTNIKYFG